MEVDILADNGGAERTRAGHENGEREVGKKGQSVENRERGAKNREREWE